MKELPKILPAGTGEKTQYLVHDSNDNTIRFALYYPGRLRPDILKDAAAAIINSVDVLHASFIPGALGAYWHVNHDFTEEDFFSFVRTDDNLTENVCQAAVRRILPSGKTQLHCTLIQDSEKSAVVLNLSHLCVDGGDGKYLLYKLAEAYELIAKTGTSNGLEVKNGSRNAFQVYEELAPKDYLSIIKPSLSKVKTVFPFPNEESGQPRLVMHSISSSVMNAARKKAKQLNATVNDILLTASYRAYACLAGTNEEALSIMSMMDLRRHCKNGESEGLCNMSGCMPTTLEHGVQGDFEQTLMEISAQTQQAKENPLGGLEGLPLIHTAVKTTPLWLLLKVADLVYGSMSIGLTNLGNLPCEPLTMDGLRPTHGLFGGPLKKKPAMQISAASFDGTAALCCASECNEEDQKLLEKMLAMIEQEIRLFASEEI